MSYTLGFSGTEVDERLGYAGEFGATSIESVTTSRALVLADARKILECDSTTDITITVPLSTTVAFPLLTEICLYQYNTGTVTFAGETAGVTISSADGKLVIGGQYHAVTLKKIRADEWLLIGSLA